MIRTLLATFLTVFLCNIFVATTHAHVLITDDSGRTGTVLHIMPDDDPIAGEPSTLYFDIQSEAFSQDSHTASLTIIDPQGQEDVVPATVAESTVRAVYRFPKQGAYKIVLTTADGATGSRGYRFTYTQRVSRGVASSTLSRPRVVWAEILLIGSVIAFAVLAIVFINRKNDIFHQSK